MTAQAAAAETLLDALKRAIRMNPALNAQRASTLAVDENLPRARSGYRPRVDATGEISHQREAGNDGGGAGGFATTRTPYGYGLQITQPLFDGFRTPNSVGQAISQAQGARELLRNTEQNTIFDVAAAYMDAYANAAILDLVRGYVRALEAQLRQTRARHGFGDVTRTDVVQVEARLAGAKSQTSVAEANLKTSMATYQQVTGAEPTKLPVADAVDQLFPPTRNAAAQLALERHPAIRAARHGIDAALLQVKIIQGELYPTINLTGSVSQRFDGQISGYLRNDAAILGQIKIPIYDGGEVRARTRQARHVSTQRAHEADSIQDQVRAAVNSGWGQLDAAKSRSQSAQAQVRAAETALNGVREEHNLGERTTYDVLNAEQDLVNAKINLVAANRDRILSSYAVAQATGTLDLQALTGSVRQIPKGPAAHADGASPSPPRREPRSTPGRSKASTADGCKDCDTTTGQWSLRRGDSPQGLAQPTRTPDVQLRAERIRQAAKSTTAYAEATAPANPQRRPKSGSEPAKNRPNSDDCKTCGAPTGDWALRPGH